MNRKLAFLYLCLSDALHVRRIHWKFNWMAALLLTDPVSMYFPKDN